MSTTRQTKGTVTRITVWIGTLAAIATWGIAGVDAQRDRGVNQPGAAGNRGRVDPGINQPGAAGNRGGVAAATPAGYGGSARQVRAVSDPGLNQPGAAGNVGRDPGLNQPGATGNRR
jgi:hypothetical protein